MYILRFVLDGLRRGWRALNQLLRSIPAVWLVVMAIVAFPIAVLSAAVAVVFFILFALLALLGFLFYLLIWRPVVRRTRRPEKVIEVEYTVKSDDNH